MSEATSRLAGVARRCAVPSLVLILFSGGPLCAQAIDPDRAREHFRQAERLSDSTGTDLWGIELYGPMLFVDRTSREVVANVSDGEEVLEQTDGIWLGTFPEDQTIANTSIEWAGRRWTMLMWPLPYGHYERGRLLAHEMFHRIQEDLGLPAGNPANEHLDREDARYWLRLEWRALREALLREGEERRTAIADALSFRARRHALFPDGVPDEVALELNEGLAEYTGIVAGGLPTWAARARAAFQLDERDRGARDGSVVRNFPYASGPAYGILLDESGVEWRPGLDPSSRFGRLLAEAGGIYASADSAAVARRALSYDGEALRAEERRRAEQRHARQAGYRERFAEGPTIVLPAGPDVRYSFDPDRMEAFEGGGTVLGIARVVGEWGALEVTGGGVLMNRDAEGNLIAFVVPAPEDPEARPVTGEEWSLELAEGWTVVAGDRVGAWTVERSGAPPVEER